MFVVLSTPGCKSPRRGSSAQMNQKKCFIARYRRKKTSHCLSGKPYVLGTPAEPIDAAQETAARLRRFTYAVSPYTRLLKPFSLESSQPQLLNSIKKAAKNITHLPASASLLIHSYSHRRDFTSRAVGGSGPWKPRYDVGHSLKAFEV